jgi:signal transduction histidine kinase
MIDSVIRNLLSNAIKFTPSGGLITLHSQLNGEYFEFSVEDTGVGISPENINKLFRLDIHHTTIGTSRERGTGLGLIICKEFVEKNGGRIWTVSEPGKGSHFNFILKKSDYKAP